MSVTVVRDLRSALGQARNQGSRPTCCAFACTDAHAACRPPWVLLSAEYAFYCGARRQGTGPADGVALSHMLDALEQEGQPVEAAWPYLASVSVDPALWVPPDHVGELFCAAGARVRADVADIRAELDQGRPVVVVMTISDAFYLAIDGDGVIDSDEPVDATRVHALVAVGHGRCGRDGLILVRNSWGESWGASGHAWLSERYLVPRLVEYATMKKVM